MVTQAAFVLLILAIAFAGSVCYELVERNERFWIRAIYRTLSWGWIGVAGGLLAVLISPGG